MNPHILTLIPISQVQTSGFCTEFLRWDLFASLILAKVMEYILAPMVERWVRGGAMPISDTV